MERPVIAKSGRSFDFQGYRVRLEAGHGDDRVNEVVKIITTAIDEWIDRRAFPCMASHPEGYLCTMPEGHAGGHVALGDGDRVIVEWSA